jgi:hypothetical protein
VGYNVETNGHRDDPAVRDLRRDEIARGLEERMSYAALGFERTGDWGLAFFANPVAFGA